MGKARILVALAAAVLLAAGCSGAVTRIDKDTDTLAKVYSDSDMKIMANDLIDDMMKSPAFLSILNLPDGKRPVVMLTKIRNETDERLGSWLEVVYGIIEEKLYQKVNFIDKRSRDYLRDVIKTENSPHVNPNEKFPVGGERGSQYIITGVLYSKAQEVGSKDYHRPYFLKLKLIERPTGNLIWVKMANIKKRITGSKMHF